MADPARYSVWPSDGKNGDWTFPELCIKRSEHGMWVKWSDFKDYKAGQRANKTLEAVTRIGIEIAEVRSQLADLEAENERLTAEVEWLRKADRLVCWNANTQTWETRFEAPK